MTFFFEKSAMVSRSRTALRVTAAAAALAALTACGGDNYAGMNPIGFGETNNLRYDVAHPISIEARPEMLEIAVRPTLAHRDAQAVREMARAFLLRADGDLTIAYPQHGKSATLVKAIAAEIHASGVPMSRVVRGPYSTEKDGDRGVVLSYYAASAVASACPRHPGDTLITWRNETPDMFGCARQHNLAAILADPRDFVSPRPMSPIASERRQQVLRNYQKGEATGSEENGETTSTLD